MRSFLVSLALLLPFIASAQTTVADKVVAVVGNSAILYSEVFEGSQHIVEQRKSQGVSSQRDPMAEALEETMLQRLLYHQALLDSLTVNEAGLERMTEQRVNQMIEAVGSAAALEKRLNLSLFSIKDNIKFKYRQMQLAQQMQQTVQSDITIIPNEVESFYKTIDRDSLPIIPEQYEYAQIVMLPPSTEDAKIRVREQLLEMRKRIIDGTRFDLLARMYSVDGSARQGGKMQPTPKEGFVAPFSEAMVKLKIGQVSEVVETEFGFHLIELLEKKDNLYTCRHILLRPVFSNQELEETNKLLDDVLENINNGTISFEAAALEYSDDRYSKSNGGMVTNLEMLELYGAYDPTLASTRFLKEELPPADYRILQGMKVGEISTAYQSEDLRGNSQAKAVKLINVIPTHTANLEEDYLKIQELALKDKQEKAFNQWLEEKILNTYVRISDEYKNAEFANKAWLK